MSARTQSRALFAQHHGFGSIRALPWRDGGVIIAEAPFIEFLQLDQEDPDWERIGRDWVQPADREAWSRLTGRAIDVKLGGEAG